jgi:hypothetical protein
VIESLTFPRLRPRTVVGNEFVLQTPRHYPVGSFTPIHAPGEICAGDVRRCRNGLAPYYLVYARGRLRAPVRVQPCGLPAGSCTPTGSFYAIGWTVESVLGGYTRCDLRLDRRHKQFYCTNIDARWDRFGRVIRRPRQAHVDDPLQLLFAKVAWDGHVVLD